MHAFTTARSTTDKVGENSNRHMRPVIVLDYLEIKKKNVVLLLLFHIHTSFALNHKKNDKKKLPLYVYLKYRL